MSLTNMLHLVIINLIRTVLLVGLGAVPKVPGVLHTLSVPIVTLLVGLGSVPKVPGVLHTLSVPIVTLLVGLGSVQPDAADQGPDHSSDDDGQTDSPGVQLFTLKKNNPK